MTRDELRATVRANDASARKPIPCRAWGVDAFMRVMSGNDRAEWEAKVFSDSGAVNHKAFRSELLARTLCDESGTPLFTAAEIGEMNFPEINRLYDVVAKPNGIGQAEEAEALKNSEANPAA